MAKKKVMYRGESFRIQSTGSYYQSGRKDSPERLLHRRIWSDNFGQIPPGMHVHHKDGDWTNNDPANLELISASDHSAQHANERMGDPEYRRKAGYWLERARIEAAKWHGSPEGIEWHKEHGKRTWDEREPVSLECQVCGSTYQAFFASRSRFCSRSCEQKEGYRRHKTAVSRCAMCGGEFVFNKYRKQTCCSRQCANRLRAQSVSGQVP